MNFFVYYLVSIYNVLEFVLGDENLVVNSKIFDFIEFILK